MEKAEKKTRAQYTILVAEDDNYLANAYRLKLQNAGYEIIMAADGKQTIESLEKDKPDLLVLDLVMPGSDGFFVLEELKKKHQKKIPVIVASNLGQKEDFDRAKELGADDYVIKSNINLEDLLAKIKNLLKKK